MPATITQYTVQGPRPYQEDRAFVSAHLLAICDGHGGSETADYCVRRMAEIVPVLNDWQPKLYLEKICNTLSIECSNQQSGTTLSLVYISDSLATVAIIGDSPVLIIDANGDLNISPEHNVRSNPAEANAGISRGGYILDGYLYSHTGTGLQLSRAIGDRRMGDVISSQPEIYTVTLGLNSAILVASDGVIDPGHTDDSAVERIGAMLESGADAETIIKSVRRLQDNATAIVWRR